MPELPEVEIVKQSLLKNVNHKFIKNVKINNRNLRFKLPNNFKSVLIGAKIESIRRFSKYIVLKLNNNFYVVCHLGMSGTIHILKNKKKNILTNSSFYNSPMLPKKHNHIYIVFNNLRIVYNDPRRFGFFKIFSDKVSLNLFFNKFGPEPFDKNFNIKYLKKKT